ncbi:MAG: endonuclease/exonuclease/phosphatase family protein [Rubripirellula sp.]
MIGSTTLAAEPLSIVTYNIRFANPRDGEDIWEHRVDAVCNFIDEHDIIGLQEVTFKQLKELQTRLSDFASYGVGRDDGKAGGEHAPIFYRKDRIEVVDKGTFWLSPEPNKVGQKGWDAALPRTCTWMMLRDTTSNQTAWIANTHFDHKGAQARTESAKLIRQIAQDRAKMLPAIVMGDFNCLPDSSPYLAITTDGWLVDGRTVSKTPASGPDSTWNGFHEIASGRVIDHLFVHGPIEVISYETLNPKTSEGRFASDHLPARITARLTANE